jgi:hypothetical protein
LSFTNQFCVATAWQYHGQPGGRLTRADDEHSHGLPPPASDKTKAGRNRSLPMFSTGLHRKYLADAKAALLAVASKDDFTVKY